MPTVIPSTTITDNVRLDHLAALDVKGADAEKFLQGQTSAQVSLANGEFAPLTCFCTPKGRMLANAQLLRLNAEHFRLVLSASLAPLLTAHLKKFAAFYRAELIHDTSVTFIGASENASALASSLGLTLPEKDFAQCGNDQASVVRLPGTTSRWLFCTTDTILNDTIDDQAQQAAWALEDIRSGLAWLTEAQQDQFLPQMLNWEALGGISFKKGCYTGQEVVARAHFRGQVKKRLMHASLNTTELPGIGANLITEQDKTMGEVVSSAKRDSNTVELLAVINTKAAEEDMPLYWEGNLLTLLPLPYPIERLDPEQLAMALKE
ncbi:YgfZ/GcvT domain-containing protein [Vreelandella nanhaiensis]|uniref:Folate-binding protein n=1 Tax=Vreelandella nanhaiensis TaxID=1258546 RepID=A0A3S0W9M5_9GAMM|nr:folate-binding protein YgfZ [Halomonas nanhaiensis]RUR32620.1 folate-binding protein [Halomonas nanhaiensis]